MLHFILAAVTMFVFFLAKEHREILLYFIIPLGPLFNMSAFTESSYMYPVETVLFTFFCLWLMVNWKSVPNGIRRKSGTLLLGFLVLVLLSSVILVFNGVNIIDQVRLVRGMFLGYFLYIMIPSATGKFEENLDFFGRTLIFSTLLIVSAAAAEFLRNLLYLSEWRLEPHSIFRGSEALAIYLSMALPFIFYYKNHLPRNLWKILSRVDIILGILVLFATRSRTVIAALFAIVLFHFLWLRRRRFSLSGLNNPLSLGVLVLSGSVLISTCPLVAGNSFSLNIPHGILEKLFASRVDNWMAGLDLILRSPIWGNGPGDNVYNLYLQTGSQFGLPALLVFMVLIVLVLKRGFQNLKTEKKNSALLAATLMAILAVLITGFGESPWGNQFAYLNWLFLLGVLPFSPDKPPDHTPSSSIFR